MSKQEFILKLLEEGREYIKLILPAVLALFVQPPRIGKKDDGKPSG